MAVLNKGEKEMGEGGGEKTEEYEAREGRMKIRGIAS